MMNNSRLGSEDNNNSPDDHKDTETDRLLAADNNNNAVTHYGSYSSLADNTTLLQNRSNGPVGEEVDLERSNSRQVAVDPEYENLSSSSRLSGGKRSKGKRTFCCILTGMQCCALFMGILIVLGVLSFLSWKFLVIPYATALAQDKIDQSSIRIDQMLITDPTKTNKLSLYSHSQIQGIPGKLPDGILRATQFDAIWGQQKFGSMAIPDTRIMGDGSTFPMNAELHVADDQIFQDFMHNAMMNTSAAMELAGDAHLTVQILGINLLTVPVKFSQTVHFSGCDSLKGASVTEFKPLVGSATEEFEHIEETEDWSIPVFVRVQFFNPANITLYPLGNMSIELHYKDVYVGHGIIANASINAGLNDIEGNVSIQFTKDNFLDIVDMLIRYYWNANSTVDLVFPANATSYSVLSSGLNGVRIPLLVPGAKYESSSSNATEFAVKSRLNQFAQKLDIPMVLSTGNDDDINDHQ
eukprot:TRINITY_DN15896_c0_g1_i1.p1 TRINITY_DN15896_c0_g1~~TRINITY_DN15896_c0_g1_i1.p1  ORF type:complete len:468 (-),score=127.19 TRINITY_DN15896_c0_g1_i1:24-1427(-)